MDGQFVLGPLGALALDAAAELHRAAFAPLGERGWTRQDVAELLASPGVAGLLLRSGDNAVGFGLCRVAADEAEVLTIAVDFAHRRQGAGRRLLAAMIDHARSSGARLLYLEVGADNPAALSLYRQEGFAEVARRAAYYERAGKSKADAVVMQLKLGG